MRLGGGANPFGCHRRDLRAAVVGQPRRTRIIGHQDNEEAAVQQDYIGVREELAHQRELGVPFPVAWSQALQLLPPISGRNGMAMERKHVREALSCTQDEWARAYERLPGQIPGLEALR